MQTKRNLIGTICLFILATLADLQIAEGGGRQPRFKETRTTNITHMAEAGLNVWTDNGFISVKRSEGADVELVAHLTCVSPERLEAVEIITERTKDQTLKVYAKWPGSKQRDNEGCSFELLLPDTRNIDLCTGNGAITCEELSGKAVLNTSNGKITINTHNGPVNATTSNGAIHAQDITGTVKLRTSNGSIEARNITGSTELHTSNGAIKAFNVVSPVNARTSNGAISLELAPSFSGRMTASTSSGPLNISDLKDAKLISSEKKRITFSIGDSDHDSSASTSNGSIQIRSLR